jgi:dipeptidyl aminopeptidase/acylaminoacyl peptidase
VVAAAVLVAIALAGASLGDERASAAGTAAGVGGYRIVLASDRDGKTRGYSVRPDGSRLTPLLPRRRTHTPQAMSADGRMVVYEDGYVSRATGAGLRRLVKGSAQAALSRDGRLMAYVGRKGIWIVRTNGRGRRRLTSGGYDSEPDWSPNAKAIAYVDGDDSIFVQPLRGRRRRVGSGRDPKWSPDGRRIGYSTERGVYVVRPDGTHRRRVAAGYGVAWSPNGKELAFTAGYLGIVGVDGHGLRKLETAGNEPGSVIWAPNGRQLIITLRGQLWTVGRDGAGLHRITDAWSSVLVGWTRLAPVLPPARPRPPTERALDDRTAAVSRPVTDLSADGSRVAFITAGPNDCDHVAVWTPSANEVARFDAPAPCFEGSTGSGLYDVELAGSRAAWVSYGGGNFWDFIISTATLADRLPVDLTDDSDNAGELWDYRLRGDGDLLVFNQRSRLVRIGVGRERCYETPRGGFGAPICTTLRRDENAGPVDSVARGLIAVREPTLVAVLDASGNVVRLFPGAAGSAWLDGDHLVAIRSNIIDRYGVATGALEVSRPLPAGYRLVDVDGGIAVLRQGRTVMLLRLDDGHSFTLTPDRGPVFADLEAPGLYYSYAVGKTGRVAFMPRADVLQRLG